MVNSPNPFIFHIRDAIDLISAYIGTESFEQFSKDKKTQDAVIRQLEIIGEATSNLESEFKDKYPQIPWREITDFRNVLAHEYWDVDVEIVWKAATKEVTDLKESLTPILTEIEKN